jgi:hypothetical protein
MAETVSRTPLPARKEDPEADAECVAMLERAAKLRLELRMLEPALHIACNDFGRRRGYIGTFNEWNVRNTLEIERGLKK